MRIAVAPQVGGTGLLLRQIERADVPAWYAYLSDAATVEHSSWTVRSPVDLGALFDSYFSPDPDSNIRFAIVQPPGDELVGTIGFHTRSSLNRTAEMAFDLRRSLWGQGIMPRCVRAVVAWGFSVLDLVRIQATAADTNATSQRVLEKCGFAREGALRNYRLIRGRPRDFWMYSVVPHPGTRGTDAQG
jgi:RimJ/RimL family protein N-acetyltransferase